ncbi:MAG: hypothetical protein UZ22_OP11002000327 [Microgenomates bacterium OLB23]|nr:MAG: hypothetical protein UZ22_OP11002000327 [Microgenomates bacterium OLB23]
MDCCKNEETTLVVQMFGTPANNNLVAQVQAAEEPEATTSPPPQAVREKDLNKVLEQKPIEGIKSEEKQTIVSAEAFSFNSSFMIIALLLFILAVDLFVAVRLKLVRVSGKNLAHWVFLGSIALALLIVRLGVVL